MKIKKEIYTIFLSLMFFLCIGTMTLKGIIGQAEGMEEYKGNFQGYSAEHQIEENELHQITRIPISVNDNASVTILVHGQGGEASHFSHDNIVDKDDATFGFAYEANSLLHILDSKVNSHIYWAVFSGDNFILYDVEKCLSGNYEQEKKSLVQLKKIETISEHAIIVFQSSQPNSYHRDVSEELHTLIDKVSYDYLVLTGRIPKVNLISHSRGGLTSMMYVTGYREDSKTANVQYRNNSSGNLEEVPNLSYTVNDDNIINDHPFNVAGLYSMGTPYWGTNWDTMFGGVAHDILPEAFMHPSSYNILDPTIQEEINQCWENAVTVNPQLRLHAIAGEVSLRFILGLIAEELQIILSVVTPTEVCERLEKYFQGIITYLNDFVDTIQSNIETQDNNQNVVFELFNQVVSLVVDNVVRVAVDNINGQIANIQETLITNIKDLSPNEIEQGVLGVISTVDNSFSIVIDGVEDIVERLSFSEESIVLSDEKSYSLIGSWGDLFIDRDSQLAVGFSNITRVRKVFDYNQLIISRENEKYVVKDEQQDRNFGYKKSTNSVGIPHNLEVHDSDIIAYILENITMGTPQSIYSYTKKGNDTICITGLNLPTYYGTENFDSISLNLTEGVDGFSVSEIGTKAFSGYLWLKSIVLPNDLSYIDSYAFEGCISLTSIDIPNSVTTIGESAFARCASLTNVNVPNGVAHIMKLAFGGCTALTEIELPDSVTYIGSGIFAECDKLNISFPNGNQNYIVEGNTLYDKEKTNIITSGKIEPSLSIPESVETVQEYAFSNNTNLRKVYMPKSLYEFFKIEGCAFYNCKNLEEIYCYSYNAPSVGEYAFLNNTFDLYTPHSTQEEYKAEFVGYNYTLKFIPIDVEFLIGGENYQTKSVSYGAIILTEDIPVREGFTFNYCTDENGNTYEIGGIWDSAENLTVETYWTENEPEPIYYTVSLNYGNGENGEESVTVTYELPMPAATAPSCLGYDFKGYYTEANGMGVQYYDEYMNSVRNWDIPSNATLYAYWTKTEYCVTLNAYDVVEYEIYVNYGDKIKVDYIPFRAHHQFMGYYDKPQTEGESVCYVKAIVVKVGDYYQIQPQTTDAKWNKYDHGRLYAHWEVLKADVECSVVSLNDDVLTPRKFSIISGQQTTLTAPTISGYTFERWTINDSIYRTESITKTFQLHMSYMTGEITLYDPNFTGSAVNSDGYMTLAYTKNPEENCVAQGTLITLADGSQVPVESLTGNEMLLVWNLHTGSFDVAPILFIDHDQAATYEIINLQFSDGTQVKVIYEHAFWDFDLNKYVFLRADAAQYIGHWFNKQSTDEYGNMIWTRVQLTGVTITEEYTTAWSPVTYGHLCLYVNGMLSMPGATEGLINIFEVDGDTMQIDQEQYLADVATYGLFTYEEFAEIYPIPEEIFEAFNGQYLKISIGKGLIDYEILGSLIERYESFFV